MKKRTKSKFQPPKDVKTYWQAPHCGPGNLDPEEICGFCGSPQGVCAQECSRVVAEKRYQQSGNGDDPQCIACGGSGFWCPNVQCGRFWANNSCGENFDAEYQAADGAELELRKDGYIHCVCGEKLFQPMKEMG